MKMLKALDLFAGAGGLSTGLGMAGFAVLYANEISPVYSQTLRANHPATFVDVEDIRHVDPAVVRGRLGLRVGELDLLAGGPPCQGFSINAPIRSRDDERNHLFWSYLRFVEEFQPRFVLIENVPGMVSFEKGEVVTSILGSLTRLGYDTSVRVLFAAHYGVPQMRWRTIFIARRDGQPADAAYPVPTHRAEGRANFRQTYRGTSLVVSQKDVLRLAANDAPKVSDAISDLPAIPNGGGERETGYATQPQSELQRLLRDESQAILHNHQCAGLGKANLARLPFIPPGGSWRDIPFDILPAGMKRARRSDHTKRYGRLDPDGISSTILTKCDPHWGTFIHPSQDRVLSVREAARLQTFPDSVVFFGSLTEQYEQVGNAVPPLFARALGESIAKCLLDDGARVHDESSTNGYVPLQSPLPLLV